MSADPRVEVSVVALSDQPDGYEYPPEVCFEVDAGRREDYLAAAQYLNASAFDVVSIQHEYGIFGGIAGDYVLDMVRELEVPFAITLHTILEAPSDDQARVMSELTASAMRVVVMSSRAADMLRSIYSVPDWKIEVIPHGVPNLDPLQGAAIRARLGLEDKRILLTFGLLSPDKGIETVIEAMPAILQKCPNALYLVVGATHPHIRQSAGEAYREGLLERVHALGLSDHVLFYNRFVSLCELTGFLAIADVYVTPYLKRAQIASGTLAYAVGCGRAVVSTPYWYAEELLDDGRGVIVPCADSEALAEAIGELMIDDERRSALQQRAAEYGASMKWPAVGRAYLTAFRHSVERKLPRIEPVSIRAHGLGGDAAQLPHREKMALSHLIRMTDETGLVQHATHDVPNYREGYCLDDNARALLLVSKLGDALGGAEAIERLESRFLAFVYYAFDEQTARFRNFMSYDRRWLEDQGSEDSHGRALWALSTASRRMRDVGRATLAHDLFAAATPPVLHFTSPRAWAFSLLGIEEAIRAYPGASDLAAIGEELAERLMAGLRRYREDGWCWFEPVLSYCNARLPEALIASSGWLERPDMLEAGLESLEWLAGVQSAPEGFFEPVGCDRVYWRGTDKPLFDQQPVEAHVSISAYLRAHRVTRDAVWYERAQTAFGWFFGKNRLGVPVRNSDTGGCHDGLTPSGLNQNQGAESTLAFQLALLDMSLAERAQPTSGATYVHRR